MALSIGNLKEEYPFRLWRIPVVLLVVLLSNVLLGFSFVRSLVLALSTIAIFVVFYPSENKVDSPGFVAKKKHVGVIGGGLSGLVSIKSLIEEGHSVECFEKEDDIGGLWNIATPGGVWSSARATASRPFLEFSDFLIPKDRPYKTVPHLSHSHYMDYLRAYANHFNLLKYITFKTKCTSVKLLDDKRYEVVLETDGKELKKTFDCLVICSGVHHIPNMPKINGDDLFEGVRVHGNSYRSVESSLAGKRVLVIGGGESGSDIIEEVSRNAASAFISLRHGGYYAPRKVNGEEADSIAFRLFHQLPRWFKSAAGRFPVLSVLLFGFPYTFQHMVFGRNDNPYHNLFKDYAKRANGALFDGTLSKSARLFKAIVNGKATVKSGVKRFTKNGVVFENGDEEQIDVVIYCTGFKKAFPFLEKDIGMECADMRNLYKFVFHPELPNLGFCGFARPVLGSMPPLCEMQARWISMIFSERRMLPSPNDMRPLIHYDRCMHKRYSYLVSERLPEMCDFHHIMNFYGFEIGCTPEFVTLLLSDPKLLYMVYMGALTSHQYRLHGPHACPDVAGPAVKNLLIPHTPPNLPVPMRMYFAFFHFVLNAGYTLTGLPFLKVERMG